MLLIVVLTVQNPAPPSFIDALARLAAQDTAGAVERLRRTTREYPRFGPAFLRLGSILSAQASEVPAEFPQRLAAERALRRAEQLLVDDPEVLLELGLLLRKQQIRVDAKRVLDRAARAAERRGDSLPPAQRARLHFALGSIYEAWWEDWQELMQMPALSLPELHCPGMNAPFQGSPTDVLAFGLMNCPEKWPEVVEAAVSFADLKDEERGRMLWHFRRALAADSMHVDAALHLLGHLADDGDWEEYDRLARRLVAARPDDPRPRLFLGLGFHERGRLAAADSAIRAGVALLPPEDRRVFENVALLLPRTAQGQYARLDSAGRAETARLFFTATDPLYLTPAEERRLEHYARLAWAELKFAAPEARLRGWDSDRGRIWVRYGVPRDWRQCCYGDGPRRAVLWWYGEAGPVFVFDKAVTYRHAPMTWAARRLADGLGATAPELYRPRTVDSVRALPHQLARFRGSRPEQTRVEIYAAPPLDSLGAAPGGALETGVFVFDRYYQPMWSDRQMVRVTDAPVWINYGFEVTPGVYRYGVEARRDGPETLTRPVARARDSLPVRGFPPGRLSVSDLLLADSVAPRVTDAKSRAQLAVWPNRPLRFAPGAPVHLVFEIYGLTVDADSLARYAVTLAVEDSTRRNLVDRVARGVVELFGGGGDQARIEWERVVSPVDDRALEFLTVDLRAPAEGTYAVHVRLTDRVSGQTAMAVRTFVVATATGPAR